MLMIKHGKGSGSCKFQSHYFALKKTMTCFDGMSLDVFLQDQETQLQKGEYGKGI